MPSGSQRPRIFGQAFMRPSRARLLFLVAVSLELVALIGLTSYSIEENAERGPDANADPASREAGLSYSTAVLLVILAVWYFVLHGTLFERRLEISFFMLASLALCMFVLFQYLNPGQDTSGLPKGARVARLVLVCASQPLNLVGGVMLIRSMDWLAFHLVGGDDKLQVGREGRWEGRREKGDGGSIVRGFKVDLSRT